MARSIGVMLSALLFLAASFGPAGAELDDGYWIIVGSLPAEFHDDAAAEAIRNRIRPCGFEPFNDFSSKFFGFRPGLNVFVLGAYASRGEANAILRAARRCVPDAYIKRGTYAGE